MRSPRRWQRSQNGGFGVWKGVEAEWVSPEFGLP